MSLAHTVFDHAITHASTSNTEILAEEVQTSGLKTWIKDNVVFVLLILIACAVLLGALKANLSRVLTVGGLSLVGLAFLGVANNEQTATGIGDWMVRLFVS